MGAQLVCIECAAAAEGRASGWRALIADDPRDDESAEVAVYCPACAEGEFGGRTKRARPRLRRCFIRMMVGD
jgi:hypothetical protein